jgi:diguanylate cyclase (GGDEF)-like protein
MINYQFENDLPQVLVVDDEKMVRLVLHRAMEKEGYLVTEASNGQHCLDICQKQLPDMVLLDAIMPEMDGFTCCSQLQALLGDNCPPVLMITVLEDQESVNRAFEVGAMDYITKPIEWIKLRQRVHRLLASKGVIGGVRQQIQRECQVTAHLEAANRKLQAIASFDSLTQIPSRHYFDEYLQREWNRLQKQHLPLSLILCEIDFFKAYNDTYGYKAKDESLRQIASIIRSCKSRAADLIARYSYQKFVVVMPNTKAQEAYFVAQKIKSTVKTITINKANCHINNYLTLSLGVASATPSSFSSSEKLIARAEKALHQTQSKGRN